MALLRGFLYKVVLKLASLTFKICFGYVNIYEKSSLALNFRSWYSVILVLKYFDFFFGTYPREGN